MTNPHMNLPQLSDDPLTPSSEAYLDAIHELSHRDGAVRSVDVAEKLNVSKVSVNKALRVLKQAELVMQEPYRGIYLTPAGEQLAHRVTWRHEVWREFFKFTLGMEEAMADSEACKLEHVASEEVVRRLEQHMKKRV